MAEQALVTYFYQSAFTVLMKKTLMIFSYRQTGLSQLAENQRLSEKDFQGFNNILVFVPNSSAEHHDTAIYEWKRSFPITYILPQEAAKVAPHVANIRVCREGDHFSIGHCDITVYGSTDAGFSYLASAEGITVFHAGDLNLWHWREENTLKEISRAESLFYEKVSKLPRDKIDISMFPLDPNQGGFYDAGANHFIMTARPRTFFPMHFGTRAEIANEYVRRGISRRTVVHALTKVRESVLIDFSGAVPLVRPTQPSRTQRLGGKGSMVDLSAYIQEDPFAHTDLPVDLREDKGANP